MGRADQEARAGGQLTRVACAAQFTVGGKVIAVKVTGRFPRDRLAHRVVRHRPVPRSKSGLMQRSKKVSLFNHLIGAGKSQ
jgi:hypothetical protein